MKDWDYVAELATTTAFALTSCISFLRPKLKRKRIAVSTAHPNRTPIDNAETTVRTKVAAVNISNLSTYSDVGVRVLVVT
jgi:hypothetical protein